VLKNFRKIDKFNCEKGDFMHCGLCGGHIGFMAAVLNLRPNFKWPRSIFEIVWSKIHESTGKTFTPQFLPV